MPSADAADAVRVKNEPTDPVPAETLGAVESPNTLLIGAIATVGIVTIVGAALYFWPKPEGTKHKVRPRSFAEPAPRKKRKAQKKQARKPRLTAASRRKGRRSSPHDVPPQARFEDADDSFDDVIDVEGVEV